MAVVGLCALAACAPQSPPPEAPPSDSPSAPASAIPGLGTTEAELLRDDTIAYWESWKRDSLTATCMVDAGLTWHVEAAFPEDRVSEIAISLGVAPVGADDGTPPDELNAASYAALDGEGRDRYALALWGESAEDIDQLLGTGATPEGRDDSFAMGGCVGAGMEAVGSIWDLKRLLEAPGASDAGSDAHKNLLDTQAARYANALEKLSEDGAFLDFLAAQA